MQETVHFVTHQELWWFIGAGISIVGVLITLLRWSNKSYILEKTGGLRKEMNEIKDNYIERFDEIKKINQEILIALEKIKTQIEYINQKQK